MNRAPFRPEIKTDHATTGSRTCFDITPMYKIIILSFMWRCEILERKNNYICIFFTYRTYDELSGSLSRSFAYLFTDNNCFTNWLFNYFCYLTAGDHEITN